jgi:hypothetical protein
MYDMKLLAVASARSIWLVTAVFLNPRGKNLVPAVAGLIDRYKFVKTPAPAGLAGKPLDLKFEGGSFVDSDGTSIFVNLSIHDDGVIAETRSSTDASDRFLVDAFSWFSENFGSPDSRLDIQKIYASEVFVQLSLPPNIFSAKFSKFIRRLEGGISNNPETPMELAALHFGPDPRATRKTAQFRVERAAGKFFDQNEYYAAAPIPTAEHLELLAAMEDAASPETG